MTRIFQVDAFTDEKFRGNPAAVCLLSAPADPNWMQSVAQEMNLSETAFLSARDDGFDLRWFTPAVEVDLCGHATLASSHVLWESGEVPAVSPARFFTKSGTLTAYKRDDWIELDFPRAEAERASPPGELYEALGVMPRYVGRNQFDYLIEVESEELVREIAPDFAILKTIPVRGVILTSRASSDSYDFVSRFFAPRSGIDEDPVTGSAHCCLGPFWQKRLRKSELVGYQASARGGLVRVRVAGDRVALTGRAVTVLKGELLDS